MALTDEKTIFLGRKGAGKTARVKQLTGVATILSPHQHAWAG